MANVIDKIEAYVNGEIKAEELVGTFETPMPMDLGFKLDVRSYVTKKGSVTRTIELEADELNEADLKRLMDLGFKPSKMVRKTITER